MMLVANCQFFATFGTAVSQNFAATCRQHALAEAVLVISLAVVWLECPFHISIIILFIFSIDFGVQSYIFF